MTKTSSTVGQARSSGSGHSRSEHGGDDERSFAEIRRIVSDVLRILSLHPWAFFVPFCVVSSAAFIISLYSPRTYTASTSFERRNDPVAATLNVSSGAAAFSHFRSTMVQDLTSVKCMGEVVENLGMADHLERDAEGDLTPASLRRRDSLARALGGRLKITTSAPSDLLETVHVTYTGPDKDIGGRLVDEAKRTYIRRTQEWIREWLVDQREYFSREYLAAKQELASARKADTLLRLENPFVDPTDPGAINVKVSQLENERRELLLRRREHEADLLAQQQVVASLEVPLTPMESDDMVVEEGPPVTLSPQLARLTEDIRKVTSEIDRLRSERGMTLQHPQVAELMKDRKRLVDELEAHPVSGPRHVVANVPISTSPSPAVRVPNIAQPWQIDLRTAKVRERALKAKLKELDRTFEANTALAERLRSAKQNVFKKQEEFAEAQDRVAKARTDFRRNEQKLAEIEPAIKLIDQNRLVHFAASAPARGGSLPILPKARSILLLSILIGVAAGIVIVVLAEIMDHVYRTSGQVARSLGLPILEAIDEIVTANDRRRLLVHRMVVGPTALGIGLIITGLTGAMAYLSLTRPTTYEKLRKIPEAAVEFFAGDVQTGTDVNVPPKLINDVS